MNKLAKRSISFVTAMFMSVMSIVTGISPSLASNPVSNVSETHDTDDVTLLVGKNGIKGKDITDTIKNYNNTYALGIASQFSVFLEGDFTPSQADAEGRIAVGGNVFADTEHREYEVGNGDFTNHVNLEALTDNSGFAHAIINGKADGLIPTSWSEYSGADGTKSYPAKKFWIKDKESFIPPDNFVSYAGDRWSKNIDDYLYEGSEAFNVAQQFVELRKRSESLSKKSAKGTFEIKEMTINGNSEKVAYLDASSYGDVCDTVYFHLTEDQWNKMNTVTKIQFVNVPKLKEPRTVFETTGENTYEKQAWDYSNIVVTVDGVGTKATPVEMSKNYLNTQTWINGISVSKEAKNLDGSGDDKKNNNAGVTSLLYNFHEAEYLVLGKDFQGTILAPDADVVDRSFYTSNSDLVNGFVEGAELKKGENTNSNGHLSGALIAKSFKGGTEFGYRPYEGLKSILGATSGYVVAVRKTDGEKALAGATLELVDDEANEIVSQIETSDEEGVYNLINVPTAIDLSGDTTYTDKTIIKEYTLKESAAPAGYNGTEKTYKIKVEETINEIDPETNIPINVSVKISLSRLDKNGDFVIENDKIVYDTIRSLIFEDTYVTTTTKATTTTEVTTTTTAVAGEETTTAANGEDTQDATTAPVEGENQSEDETPNTPAVQADETPVDDAPAATTTEKIEKVLTGRKITIDSLNPWIIFNLEIADEEVKSLNKIIPTGFIPGTFNYQYTESPVENINLKENNTFDVAIEVFPFTNNSYYYDAESMMISNIPQANEMPTFVNEAKKFQLKKIDASDGASLAGAEIAVYKEDTEAGDVEIVEPTITGDNGIIELGHLTPGKYYIKETKVPSERKLPNGTTVEYMEPVNEKIYFTINDDYTITGEKDKKTFPVTYTLKYDEENAQAITGFGNIGEDDEVDIEGVKTVSKTTDHFTEKDVVKEKKYYYNEENSTNYNIDCAGKKIKKIVVNVSSAEGAGIQFKNGVNEWGGDEQFAEFSLKEGKNEFDESKLGNQAVFNADAYMKLTFWNADIESIEYYCDGLVSDAIDDTAKIDSITIKCDNYLEGTIFTVNDGTNKYTGTVDSEGNCVIKGINGKTFNGLPQIEAIIDNNSTNISNPDKDDSLVIKLPNKRKRPESNHIEINKVNMRGVEVVGAELTLKVESTEDGTGKINDSDGNLTDVLTWTSDADDTWVIDNIKNGTYTLHEDKAPDGYVITSDIEFKVTDGKITVLGEDEDSNITVGEDSESILTDSFKLSDKKEGEKVYSVLEMRDGRLLKLKKTDADGNALTGAVFRLTATNIDTGKAIEFNTDIVRFDENYAKYVRFNDAKTAIIWNSNGLSDDNGEIPDMSDVEIRNLPNGNYTLEEITAPDGYKLTGKITFTLNKGIISNVKNGTLETYEEKDNGGGGNILYGIVAKDQSADIRFMKRAFSGTIDLPVPGATLTLKGVKTGTEEPIVFKAGTVTIGEGGKIDGIEEKTNPKDITELKWITGKEYLTIKNIPDGTYTYHEESAPTGYEKSTDITFDVENGVIKNAKIKNAADEPIDYKYTTASTVTMYDRKVVEISKQDNNGNLVAGATLVLTGKKTVEAEDGTKTEQDDVTFTASNVDTTKADILKDSEGNATSIQWVSDGENNLELMGLPDGDYTLVEAIVPAGYEKAKNITFKITDQKITNVTNGKLTPDNAIVMVDKKIEDKTISISKQEVVNGESKELAGATLVLTGKKTVKVEDENGTEKTEDVTFTASNVDTTKADILDKDNKVITEGSGVAVQWVSNGKEDLVLKNLPNGEYTLKETAAPDGYTIATEIKFTIKDGKVVGSTDNKVVVTDSVSTIHISKKEVAQSKELAGAELTLTLLEAYKNGSTLNDIIATQNNTKAKGFAVAEGGLSVSFVSVEKYDTVIEKLPDGKYQLTEIQAPQNEGKSTHEKADAITFTIENGVITSIELSEKDKANYESNDNAIVSSTATGVVMRDATITTTTTTEDTTTTTTTTEDTTTTTTTTKNTTTTTTVTEETTTTTKDTTTTTTKE
ncbi:MAG: choice-of-anchor A family protein, partial [Ruminococcus sp.]|nr:choice-of-anchor A family protein [Ruminococcus sp.]